MRRFHTNTAMYIMITYKTLQIGGKDQEPSHACRCKISYLTAGASELSGTMAKPAARTAADCSNAADIRVPMGMASITLKPPKDPDVSTITVLNLHFPSTHGFPISKTKKDTKSNILHHSDGQLRIGNKMTRRSRQAKHHERQEPGLG